MIRAQAPITRLAQQLAIRCQSAGSTAVLACCPEELGTIPSRACSSAAAPQEGPSPVQAEVKRMMYRARQRGFLELDLLVGLWAEENVPSLPRSQLGQLQTLLECENPDLFKWLTGQAEAPAELLQNSVFKSMQQSVRAKLSANRPQSAASAEGKQWVRGWDDAWREKSSESAEVPATGGDNIPK